jgi:multicomponent Na+:H+ antiporter subunit G
MFNIIGFVLILIGAIFLLISAIGLLRMPDTLTRMHAGTKASTLGSLLIIIGTMFLEPSLSFKLGFLALFILITNPLSSSILARSTYIKYGFLNQSGLDDLKEKKK